MLLCYPHSVPSHPKDLQPKSACCGTDSLKVWGPNVTHRVELSDRLAPVLQSYVGNQTLRASIRTKTLPTIQSCTSSLLAAVIWDMRRLEIIAPQTLPRQFTATMGICMRLCRVAQHMAYR